MVLIDSNILISFFTERYEEQTAIAKDLITSKDEKFYILDQIISETEYVLRRIYNTSKSDIYTYFSILFLNPNIRYSSYIPQCLKAYVDYNIDFADAILLITSSKDNKTATFDKKLKKLLKEKSYF